MNRSERASKSADILETPLDDDSLAALKTALDEVSVDAEVVRLLREDPSSHVWQPWEDTAEAKRACKEAKHAARSAVFAPRLQNQDKDPANLLENLVGRSYTEDFDLAAVKTKVTDLDTESLRELALSAILELRKVREVFRQEFKEGFASLQAENDNLRDQLDRMRAADLLFPASSSAVVHELDVLIQKSTQEMNFWGSY